MRTVLVASVRTHTRRYLAAAVAVMVAVGFVVATDAFTSALRSGLTAGIDAPFRNADVVLTGTSAEQEQAVLAHARKVGAHAAPQVVATLPLTHDGRMVRDDSAIGIVSADPQMRWQPLVTGSYPAKPGEAVVDVNAAKADRLEVGDRIAVGSGAGAVKVRLVGTVDSPSAPIRAGVYLLAQDYASLAEHGFVYAIAYAGTGSVADQIKELEKLADGASVTSRASYLQHLQTEINHGVDVLAIILLLFGGIALFVSVMVIANTFSILFAQRVRDFALLRCVGATRRQVLRSVRLEALLMGLGASLAGLLVGVGLGHGAVAAVGALAPSARLGPVALSPVWLVGAFVLGVVVTVVAAWLPTRQVVAVRPLEALRPAGSVSVRTGAGRLRIAFAAAAVTFGGALLALATSTHSMPVMMGGGMLCFLGVVWLGPVLVPAIITLVDATLALVLRRSWGPASRLAAGNAVRNPRRTAATTSALLVGVTLCTAVLTGLAGARGALATEMDKQNPVDGMLTLSASTNTLPADLLTRVRATPGVSRAVGVPGAPATIGGEIGQVSVLAPNDVRGVSREADFPRPGRHEVLLPYGLGAAEDGAKVEVKVAGRTRQLTVVRGEGWGTAALVAPSTLAALAPDATVAAVWLRAKAGTDPDDLTGDLSTLVRADQARVEGGLASRHSVDLQLDVLAGTVVGLLAVSIIIALVGIANTLGLSVLERGRENALLRALGLTRRQLRRTLAVEALLLALTATVIGTLLGVTFAWVGMVAMVRDVVADAPLVLPWGQLAVVVLVAAVAGLLASVLPARRAARVTPAAGLSLD